MGICQEANLSGLFPRIALILGEAYTLGGRVADAVPLLTQTMEQATTTEMEVDQALCSLSLGEAQVLAGRLEEAHALASGRWRMPVSTRNVATRRMPCASSATLRRGANLWRASQAEAPYHQALALADELGMRPLLAHCHRGLGTLYATLGRGDMARTALATAIALYRAMDMTFWLPEAEAALARIV